MLGDGAASGTASPRVRTPMLIIRAGCSRFTLFTTRGSTYWTDLQTKVEAIAESPKTDQPVERVQVISDFKTLQYEAKIDPNTPKMVFVLPSVNQHLFTCLMT
jgi:hypothetical protein